MLPSKAQYIGVALKRPSDSTVSFFLYFIFIFSSFFNHMEGSSLLFTYSRLSNVSLAITSFIASCSCFTATVTFFF